jgi:hypothetical protein
LRIENFMNKSIFFSLLILSTIFFGCSKKISKVETRPIEGKKFGVEELDFQFLETRARIMYDDGNTRQSANANIRIKKDSIIWFSVSPGLGLEALRGMITRDSLVYINRLNRTYGVYSFESLSKKFNFKLNYDILQAMLLGNLPVEIQGDDRVDRKGDFFLLKQKSNTLKVENQINADTQKLESVLILEKPTNNTLNLRYSDFQQLQRQLFAQSTLITLNYQTKQGTPLHTEIKIDHKHTEIDQEELKFPFYISDKYERR